LDDTGFDGKMPLLSSLPKKPISDYYSTSNTTVNANGKRVTAKTFTLKLDSDSYQNRNSDYWEPAVVDFDNDKGLYVVIDRFCAETGEDSEYATPIEPRRLISAIKSFAKFLEVDAPVIYAVKKAQAQKVQDNDNWQSWFDFAQEAIKKQVEDEKLVQSFADRAEVVEAKNSEFHLRGAEKLAGKVVVRDGDYALFYQRLSQMTPSQAKEARMGKLKDLARSNRVKLDINDCEPTHNLTVKTDALAEKYPMITYMDNWQVNRELDNAKSRVSTNVIDYINMVDVTNSKSVF
jgi:hypothetical protein